MARVAGLVALAGAALALSDGAGCSRRADRQTGAASLLAGASGPRAPRAASVPATVARAAVAAGAADFELWNVERVRAELRRRRGQPLVVHMWASWCGPCLEELPLIDAFARRARERGIAVLSLALDTDYRGGGRVPAVLHDRAPHLTPIIARFDDAGAFMSLFSRQWEGTIPALFVFDRGGKLRRSWFQPVEAAELQQLIDQMGDSPRAPPGQAPSAATIHL